MKRLFLACLMAWPVAGFAATPTLLGLNLSINCPGGHPMSIVSTVRPGIYAVIISFLSKAAAQQYVANMEARSGETIDPAYAGRQRVLLEWRVGPGAFERTSAAVPENMTVHIGEGVTFVPGHGDPNNLCLFIPNLIMP